MSGAPSVYVNAAKNRASFTLEDADRAAEQWGANCGPGALAAVLNLTLTQVRAHLGDFERKGYTNPTLMFAALRSLGARWSSLTDGWPTNGLLRIQWEGPWTAPGVPIRVRYRHTHWIAARYALESANWEVFDINAICVGGWIPYPEWSHQLVPWLLRECQPKANGKWHPTHRLEIRPAPAVPGEIPQ